MPTTCVSLKQCPTSTSIFDVWMFVSLLLPFIFHFFVSVRVVRYELWICVTWSFKMKPAVPVSLLLSSTDERDEGVTIAAKILLFLKGYRLFLVNRRQIFLHLFVFRYSAFPAEVALFTTCLLESYLCLVSWINKQNKPILMWHGLITLSSETVECISMPYQVYFLLSSHCSPRQVICIQ